MSNHSTENQKLDQLTLFIYNFYPLKGQDSGLTVCTDLFSKIRKNVRNGESVHDDFEDFGTFENPYMGFLKIRTFYWDYSMKGPFSSFFQFVFLPFFSKFLRFVLIYNVYFKISNEFLII